MANNCTFVGNLTADPEPMKSVGEHSVVRFRIAVNERISDRTLYLDCEAWNKLGEIVSKYLTKGSKVYVQGALRLDTWEDKNTGQNRSKHFLNVGEMEMLGSGKKTDEPAPAKKNEEEVPF